MSQKLSRSCISCTANPGGKGHLSNSDIMSTMSHDAVEMSLNCGKRPDKEEEEGKEKEETMQGFED